MDLCEQLANDLKDLEKQEIENNEEDQQIKDFISKVSILDSQISQYYQQVKEIYQTKISELHEIVVDPATYCEVVSSLIESNDVSKLKGLIPSDQIITIAVTTSAPKQELDQSQSQNCVQLCQKVKMLNADKQAILQNVQEKMPIIAPNLCEFMSAELAAKIVVLAGGLKQLAQTPTCNIINIGAEGKQAKNSIVSQHILVKQTPDQMQHKALRYIANKCALAARVDLYKKENDNKLGRKLFEDVRERILKLQEGPMKNTKKVLDKPITKIKDKRGGRKVRA